MYGIFYIILAVGLVYLPLYVQWKIIELGLPRIGKLIGMLIIPLGWVYLRFVIMPQPSDCIEPLSCEWAGILLLLITLYSIVDLIVAAVGGSLIHLYFQKRVWGADDIILQAGKTAFILI